MEKIQTKFAEIRQNSNNVWDSKILYTLESGHKIMGTLLLYTVLYQLFLHEIEVNYEMVGLGIFLYSRVDKFGYGNFDVQHGKRHLG